jgi:cobalamin synthase
MAKSNCDKKYKILILGDSSVGKVGFILLILFIYIKYVYIEKCKIKELYLEKIC